MHNQLVIGAWSKYTTQEKELDASVFNPMELYKKILVLNNLA
jgi:hypothetical protein